jgi:hypothetical protein
MNEKVAVVGLQVASQPPTGSSALIPSFEISNIIH